MTNRDSSTATYKTNPRFAKSAITGHPMAERSPEERAECRKLVATKLREEEAAMQVQRERIADLTKPKHKHVAANDNTQIAAAA